MNKNLLVSKIGKLFTATKVDHNTLYKYFFMENLMELLITSKYSSNFVFKGGSIISVIFGLNCRFTKDLDCEYKEYFKNDYLLELLQETLKNETQDGVWLEILKTKDIYRKLFKRDWDWA